MSDTDPWKLPCLSRVGWILARGKMTIITDQINRAPAGYYRAEGMIKNVNTIEEYRNMDKPQMIIQSGRTVKIILFGETICRSRFFLVN